MSAHDVTVPGQQAAAERGAAGGTVDRPSTEPAGHSKGRGGVVAMYSVAVGVVLAAAVVLSAVLTTSVFFWPMTLLGAVVIGLLLTAAAMPYFRND